MDRVKIALDTRGGDKGAPELLKGAKHALEKFEELDFALFGDEKQIRDFCEKEGIPPERAEIIGAKGEITNYDDPSTAIFAKTDSSMLVALETLSKREDIFGMISCGNTAVLITGAVRYLPCETRVRPALAGVLPAKDGGFVCLCDIGATTDCTAQMLCHFARLASDFMRENFGIESPRVGLLSNGAEETKGNKLVKETHPLLKADGTLNFVGNVEANDALAGKCDVLVCDGFAGNTLLKATEGAAMRIMTDMITFANREKSEDIARLGAHLMKIYDISSLGGGIILGAGKPVIKARGSAGEKAVAGISQMLLNMARNKAVFDNEKIRV